MQRVALFALLLFSGTAVLCQSTATPPGNAQAPGKLSTEQWPLDFSNGQAGQAAARPTFKPFTCNGQKSTPNQASAPIDFNHLFNTSCMDLKSHVDPVAHVELFALNENSYARSPLAVRPQPKGEAIPGQWPNLKFEQIPTEWPNLKLRLINGGSTGSIPADSKAK